MDEACARRRIGINIASMLPWSAFPLVGLSIAEWITRRAGFAFWQILPLRSVSISSLKRVQIPIRYLESAWNATTLWRHLSKKPGSEGMPTKWQDVLFFPSPQECMRRYDYSWMLHPNIVRVSHHPSGNPSSTFMEFHSGLNLRAEELATALRRPRVVLDTYHLRYFVKESPRCREEWEQDLEILSPVTALVHVQADGFREWSRFLEGFATNMQFVIEYLLGEGFLGDFVVVYRPGSLQGKEEILFPWVLARSLKQIRDRLLGVVLGK